MKNVKTIKDFINYLYNLEHSHKQQNIYLYINEDMFCHGHTTPEIFIDYPHLFTVKIFKDYQDYEIDHIDPIFCDEGIALIKYRVHIKVANS